MIFYFSFKNCSHYFLNFIFYKEVSRFNYRYYNYYFTSYIRNLFFLIINLLRNEMLVNYNI